MKVIELIQALSRCDPEKEVIIEFDLGCGWGNCDQVIEGEDKVVVSELI